MARRAAFAGTIGPHAYADWRKTVLGAITERIEQRLIVELVGEVAGCHALDIGCGDGLLGCEFASRGATVVGTDPDPAMVERALARAAATRVAAAFFCGCAEQLPFAADSFDTATIVTVLSFVPDATAAVREISRVLRPGGRLVIGELGRWNLWAASRRLRGWLGSPTWKAARFRSAAELCNLAKAAGLEVTEIRSAIYFPPLGFFARAMAPIDPWLAKRMTFGAAFIALAATRRRQAPDERPPTGCAPAASA